MVHGFHASHIADYNQLTKPTFSVGEYDWGKQGAQRGWIWNTSTNSILEGNERLKKASSVFDFTTHFTLKDNIGRGSGGNANYLALYGFGNGIKLVKNDFKVILYAGALLVLLFELTIGGWLIINTLMTS